jgi:hypothetical protein
VKSNSAASGALYDLRAILLGICFAFLWALVDKLGERVHVSVYEVVWFRYGVQLAVVAVIAKPRLHYSVIHSSRPLAQGIASLMMLATSLFFIFSIKKMNIDDVMAIFWFAPLFLAVASSIGEAVATPVWIGTICATVGAVAINRPDGGVFRATAILPLGMAASFALYQIVIGSLYRERTEAKLFHTALWIFLIVTFRIPWFWRRPSLPDIVIMGMIGLLGVCALFVFDRALEMTRAVNVAPAICTQSIWSALLSSRFHHSTLLAGAFLIIAGATVPLLWGKLAADPPQLEPTA